MHIYIGVSAFELQKEARKERKTNGSISSSWRVDNLKLTLVMLAWFPWSLSVLKINENVYRYTFFFLVIILKKAIERYMCTHTYIYIYIYIYSCDCTGRSTLQRTCAISKKTLSTLESMTVVYTFVLSLKAWLIGTSSKCSVGWVPHECDRLIKQVRYLNHRQMEAEQEKEDES